VLCPTCQTDNPETSKFCRECGTHLALTCAGCGSELAAGTKFCPECGRPQASAPTAVEDEDPPRQPPDQERSGAERRVVSVLFLDLVSFTTLAEGRDAEDVRDLLTRYFDLARETVARYGGTIEKFIGDAVMAVWGTPTAHEDDAERAVRAALDLVEGVDVLGGELSLPGLAARAGILTGEAAVTIGADQQGMVAGDLVNTAARLQSAADAGTVLVGEATRRATEDSIAYEPAGTHQLKGKELPLSSFVARRVTAKRRGEGRSEVIEPPFVGRDAELRLLKDLFHATGSEQRPRMVSIVGQGGIGKSRISWELLKYVDGVTELAYWHNGRSPAYGDGVAFWALGEMVRSRAEILEGEDDDRARQKLGAMLEEFVPDAEEREWIASALENLLGVGSPADDEVPASRERVFAAWRTFFERIAQRGTVVMVFEDLHWADAGLLDFIEHLLDWSRGSPIYVVALARPELLERRGGWGVGRRNTVALPLEPLPQAAMRRLLDGMIPGLPETAAAAILDRAEGIPLYAVETVRMLVQDGRLEAVDGGYRPRGDIGDVAVPSSLHALIAARLDALEAPERELLQAVSVLGKTFSVEAAAAVAGGEVGSLEPRLRDLVRRELLVIDADPRSPERGQYGYLQGLMREVAYSTLARRDRRRLHLAAAQHFETTADDELSGILATHYVAAHEAQPEGPEGEAVAAQARVALRAAAERAGRLGSWDRAHGYLSQALVVTDDPSERADLLEGAAAAARLSAQHDLAYEAAREAVSLRESLGDRRKLIASSALLGRVLVSRGVLEPAREFLERAADAFRDDIDTAEYVALAGPLTQILMRVGEDERCIELCDRLLPVAERHGPLDATLEILINRATALTDLNRPVEGAATLVGAIDMARLHEMPVVELRAIVNLSLAGELDEPRITQNQRGLELVERYGLRSFLLFMLNNYAEEAMARGAWSDALARIDGFVESALSETESERTRTLTLDIQALRGEVGHAEIARGYEWVKELGDDRQVVSARHVTDQRLALAEGRLAESVDLGMAAIRAFPGAGVSPISDAAHAAVRIGDLDRARAARAELAERPGRMAANHLRAVDAGIAALEDRAADALEGFREACAVFREVGLIYWLAITELTMLHVLEVPPQDLQELAEEARGRFEAMGAAPLVRQVDEALRARVPDSSRVARDPGAEAVSTRPVSGV
jgi:class 3 adenylate cyclase/tetratricopeptide (TPR) repeat protein